MVHLQTRRYSSFEIVASRKWKSRTPIWSNSISSKLVLVSFSIETCISIMGIVEIEKWFLMDRTAASSENLIKTRLNNGHTIIA